MKNVHDPIVVEQTYDAPRDSVWRAITEVDRMTEWFFEEIPDFRPEIGFNTEFNVRAGHKDFLHQWKVTQVQPGEKIAYTWRYQGHPGQSDVKFELQDTDSGTHLKLTHRGIDSFPTDISEFSCESCTEGWNYFLKERLPVYLNSMG